MSTWPLYQTYTPSLTHTHTPIHRIHPYSIVTPKHHTTNSVREVTCTPTQHSSHQIARRPGFEWERHTGDHVVADGWLSPPMLIAVNIRYQWGSTGSTCHTAGQVATWSAVTRTETVPSGYAAICLRELTLQAGVTWEWAGAKWN